MLGCPVEHSSTPSLSTQMKLSSLQFSGDTKVLRRVVILEVKNVGLTADLAILHITLPSSGRFIHGRCVPFPASRALETGFQRWKEHTAMRALGMLHLHQPVSIIAMVSFTNYLGTLAIQSLGWE